MNKANYAITFATYNQIAYTQKCIASLVNAGIDLQRVVVVDNGSTDTTVAVLQTLPLGGLILNRHNFGCGVAWNQGILALQAEWTIVMNNDLVVTAGWLDGLLQTAQANNLKIVSPALIEGQLDYDIVAFALNASHKMQQAVRLNFAHAICMAIHESVWMDVGLFRATPKLFGFEDTLFFNEVRTAKIRQGMIGASWIHHFGSITQQAMKQERGLTAKQGLGNRGAKRLLGLSWLERKLLKALHKQQMRQWRQNELARYGVSMYGLRENGQFVWR